MPGSTFSRDLEVAAAIDRILGGTTDCSPQPGTCILAATRLELDGSLSLHPAPLAFSRRPE